VPFVSKNRNPWAFVLVLLVCAIPLWNAFRYQQDMKHRLSPETVVHWIEQNIPAGSTITVDPSGPTIPNDKFVIKELGFREFRGNRFEDSDYVCVAEDFFREMPASLTVVKEFPRQTRSLDRAIRIYKVP
jgi:hypothetical protein